MQAMKLSDVKRGEFILRTPDAKKVYSKGDYDSSYKKYRINDTEDISRDVLLRGSATVYVEFTY